MPGFVDSIHLAEAEAAATFPVESCLAFAGRGVEGDRNFAPPTATLKRGYALTLVEVEALEAVLEETGIDLRGGRSRRQVHTRGVRLNELVGEEFTVGSVRCRGVELCEPCRHLESLTEPGVLKALVHRGGLRADVLADGEIAVGDGVS